jgi:hypothetical protein
MLMLQVLNEIRKLGANSRKPLATFTAIKPCPAGASRENMLPNLHPRVTQATGIIDGLVAQRVVLGCKYQGAA